MPEPCDFGGAFRRLLQGTWGRGYLNRERGDWGLVTSVLAGHG